MLKRICCVCFFLLLTVDSLYGDEDTSKVLHNTTVKDLMEKFDLDVKDKQLLPEPPDLPESGRGKASKEVVPRKGVEVTSEEVEVPSIPLPVNMTEEGKKGSSPRKGAPKQEPSKPRKGVEALALNETEHKKPLGASDSDSDDGRSGIVAIAVGLCVGLLVLSIFLVLTVKNMRNAWNRQQYRRMDFLIENMYGEA